MVSGKRHTHSLFHSITCMLSPTQTQIVFLAIKNAYDTLMDPVKRNGYDSTVLVFDDSIPPSRNTLLLNYSNSGSDTSNNNNSYTDDDFYQLYGPVFTRNLRFDAKLRPELAMDSNSSNNSSSHSSSKKNNNNKTPISPPPSLGDADTPLDQVYAFYEYWQSFSSWRDFSLQAQCELQLSDVLEQSESRYEKRYYQKEIDKRTKQLKRNEMTRIQTLVERAMEADPRLYVGCDVAVGCVSSVSLFVRAKFDNVTICRSTFCPFIHVCVSVC